MIEVLRWRLVMGDFSLFLVLEEKKDEVGYKYCGGVS